MDASAWPVALGRLISMTGGELFIVEVDSFEGQEASISEAREAWPQAR